MEQHISKAYDLSEILVIRNPAYNILSCCHNKPIKGIITEKMKDVFFRNAILLSSISFYDQLKTYCGKHEMSPKQERKVEFAFTKYLNRMSTRPTPYGMFSTLSITTIEKQKNGYGDDKDCMNLHIHLHMGLLENIAQKLSIEFREFINFSVNSTLSRYESDFTYIKYSIVSNKQIHEAVSCEYNPYIEFLFNNLLNDYSLSELTDRFQNIDESISINDLIEFINNLIEEKILISELDIIVTEGSYQNRILRSVDSLLGRLGDNYLLQQIKSLFLKVESLTVHDDLGDVRTFIIAILNELAVPFNPNHIFHANLYRSQPKTPPVSEIVISNVLKGLNILSFFSLKRKNEDLIAFKKEFQETYGTSFLPLTQVMSTTLGLGYPINRSKIDSTNQILQQLSSPPSQKPDWVKQNFHTKNHTFWLNKYADSLTAGKSTITLTDDDLKGFETSVKHLPHTFSCSFSLISTKNDKQIDLNHEIKFNGWGGSSAINFLARFANDSNEIYEVCKKAAAVEASLTKEDEIIAEICHISDTRVGDVLAHSPFRNYEIPYLVNSSVTSNNKINISDILVGVFDNEIILYSLTLKKKIKPILSNAHNHRLSEHPVYKFLCELQEDRHINGPYIDFGQWSEAVSFFPQVRYKNLILVQRGWSLESSFFSDYRAGKETEKQLNEKFSELPFSPKEFLVDRGDNELYVNLDYPYHWQIFLDYCSKVKNGKVILKEFEGYDKDKFSNEIIISLFKKQ